jgi:hypothetical protein
MIGVAGQLSYYHDSLSVFSTLFVLLNVLEPPVKTASRPDHPLLTYVLSNTPV